MTRYALIAAFALGALTTGGASIASTDMGSITSGKGEAVSIEKRRKPRVPGGSGCDTPRDILQHPECR